MKVWELNITDIDYTSFYLPEDNKTEELQAVIEKIHSNEFSCKDWKPPVLLKQEQRIDPDFFDLSDLGVTIISSKVKEVLEAIFSDNTDYELLPFICEEDTCYLFRLKKTIDCLEKEESFFDALPSGQILSYENLVFNTEKIDGVPIFKIPELPFTLFTTHAFKYFYDKAGLKGIDF